MKILKIQNQDLETLVKATSVSLSFERSRARNKFLQALKPALEAREKSKMEIITKFCKMKDGKPDLTPQGMYQFETKEVDAEYNKLQNEEAIIDILPSIEDSLKVIKEIITTSEQKLEPGESMSLERVVEAIEAVK